MQKETCCTANLLTTFDLFDKSPAFLNFSSPQLVRWSAYCMQKSACKKTQDFYWLFIWQVYSGIPRPAGQKKKRKTNKIPAPWTMLDTVKLGGKGSFAQHWPGTINTALKQPKTTTLKGPIEKNIIGLWTQTRTFLTVQPRFIVFCYLKPLHQSTSLTWKRVHNLPHHVHWEQKTQPSWELTHPTCRKG